MLNSYYKNSEPTSTEFGLIVRLVTPTTAVPITGTVMSTPVTSSTATRTQVAAAAVNTVIAPANANRRKIIITNTDMNTLRLACGAAAATSTNYTLPLNTNESYIDDDFVGIIQGIWDGAAGGAALVTEFT